MKRVVLGTAGHIDHGKTSLVRALTGIDTDRLREEKRRGITIELGFAHLALPDGTVAGVVDVPGHERFVRAMAAGAGGVDLVILVVAADEGVMPQTREHLDICRLLGVPRGLVALTKADLLPTLGADWLPLLEQDVRGAVKGTFLEGSPILPVSAASGDGLPALVAAIGELAAEVSERPDARGGREEDRLVPLADLAGEEGPRHHRAEALHREGAVHGQEQGPVGGPLGDLRRDPAEGGDEAGEPLAGGRGHREDGGALEEGALGGGPDLLLEEREPVGAELGEEVRLRHGDDAAGDTEEPADVEVLAGLGHHPLVRGDDEDDEVDPARARGHGADEPLVARDDHDAGDGPVRQCEVREPQLDRDPAALLLAQPIGVDPSERADERGLPVVDVARGPDDDALHGRDGGVSRAGAL